VKVRPEPAWIILENAAALCHGVLEVGERREGSDDPRHTPWLASATHGASVYRRFRPPGIPSDSIARKPYEATSYGMPHNGHKQGVPFERLGGQLIQEQSMDIDWWELPFTATALGVATVFIWGIAFLG
jgi:hypothetical protein